ncbi:MAG: hypothetical protein M3474_04340 [Actinomycetota bacterium]|nr:hypothetical protein [Actinomycetota bacterium]
MTDRVPDRAGADVFNRDHGGALVGDRGRLLLPAGRVVRGSVRKDHAVITITPRQRVVPVDRDRAPRRAATLL